MVEVKGELDLSLFEILKWVLEGILSGTNELNGKENGIRFAGGFYVRTLIIVSSEFK